MSSKAWCPLLRTAGCCFGNVRGVCSLATVFLLIIDNRAPDLIKDVPPFVEENMREGVTSVAVDAGRVLPPVNDLNIVNIKAMGLFSSKGRCDHDVCVRINNIADVRQ